MSLATTPSLASAADGQRAHSAYWAAAGCLRHQAAVLAGWQHVVDLLRRKSRAS